MRECRHHLRHLGSGVCLTVVWLYCGKCVTCCVVWWDGSRSSSDTLRSFRPDLRLLFLSLTLSIFTRLSLPSSALLASHRYSNSLPSSLPPVFGVTVGGIDLLCQLSHPSVVPRYTELYRVISRYTVLYRDIQSCTVLYRVGVAQPPWRSSSWTLRVTAPVHQGLVTSA